MNVDKKKIAEIFNEWADRYAKDPNSFDDVLDEHGNVIEDYGERCAAYFVEVYKELGK